MRNLSRTTALLVLCLVAATPSACTGGVPKGPVPRGVTHGKLGGIEAVGYIERSGAKGGTWLLYDAKSGASGSSKPKLVAMLRPAPGQSFLNDIEGRYVWVAGRSSGAKSDAPPTIIVDALEPVEEP